MTLTNYQAVEKLINNLDKWIYDEKLHTEETKTFIDEIKTKSNSERIQHIKESLEPYKDSLYMVINMIKLKTRIKLSETQQTKFMRFIEAIIACS